MTTGDHSLTSARARLREMALDPQDLATRAEGLPDLRSRNDRGPLSRRARVTRAAMGAVILGALLVGAVAFWQSAVGTTVREELDSARSGLLGLSGTQTGTAVGEASPGPDARPAVLASVVGTAGTGVAIRDACLTEARTGGVIAEGATVTVVSRGVGDCSGWSFVEANGETSWVRNSYLEVAPSGAAAAD
jgi:hypothetical protein